MVSCFARVAGLIPCGLAAARHRRGADHRRGNYSQGDGVCHDGRAAGAGRPLHRPGADDDIRGAWDLARTQRQHDYNVGDPDRRSVGAGRARRQPRSPAESVSDVDAAGGGRAFDGVPAAPGKRSELYLRAGARRVQSRHRAGHCSGPDSEDPWHPLHQRNIRSERPVDSSHPSKNVVSNTCRRAHSTGDSAEHGAFPAETASAVAGGSCCDSGRVLLEFATLGASNWWATYRQDCPRW